MAKVNKVLIGSNNAYGWYAALGVNGELIDWGTDHDMHLRGGESTIDAAIRLFADYLANGEHWEGSWDDAGRDKDMAGMLNGRDLDDMLASGEDTALEFFGGEVEHTIDSTYDMLTYRGQIITREPEGDHEDHVQHATHVNPLGRRNHCNLSAALRYIDDVHNHPDVVAQRASSKA